MGLACRVSYEMRRISLRQRLAPLGLRRTATPAVPHSAIQKMHGAKEGPTVEDHLAVEAPLSPLAVQSPLSSEEARE